MQVGYKLGMAEASGERDLDPALAERTPGARQLLPFGVVALVAQISVAFQAGLEYEGVYLAATITLALVVGIALLLPWQRMPPWSLVLVPLGLAVWVGLILASQRKVETGLTTLVLLPIVWAALYQRAWEAMLIVLAVVSLLEFDSAVKHDPTSVLERQAVLWAILATLVVVSAHTLRRRLVGAIVERQEAVRQAELLGAATRELTAILDPHEVVATGCRLAAEIASPPGLPAWHATFYRVEGEEIFVDAEFDPGGATTGRSWSLSEHPLLLKAVRTRVAMRGPSDLERSRPAVRDTVHPADVTHGACVPIAITNRQLYGLLTLTSRGPAISREQLARCADVGRVVELALKNAIAHQQSECAAITDPLTGLANRRGLEQLLRERRGRRTFAVLAIDLDGLKGVNDADGHAAGDALLVLVAGAISRALREGDVAARTGGDEFVMVAFDADKTSALVVAQRTLDCVRAERTDRLIPRISIGVACGQPQESPEDVLTRADAALYRAKRTGGARFELADQDLRAAARSARS